MWRPQINLSRGRPLITGFSLSANTSPFQDSGAQSAVIEAFKPTNNYMAKYRSDDSDIETEANGCMFITGLRPKLDGIVFLHARDVAHQMRALHRPFESCDISIGSPIFYKDGYEPTGTAQAWRPASGTAA